MSDDESWWRDAVGIILPGDPEDDDKPPEHDLVLEGPFAEGLVDDDGRLDFGLLSQRITGTIFWGAVLLVISLIDGLRSLITTPLIALRDYLIRSGGFYDTLFGGLTTAISSAESGLDPVLDPLGPLSIIIAISIAIALGAAVVRVTIIGVEIIIGSELS